MEQISLETFRQSISPSDLSSGSIFGALSADATLFLLEHGKIYRVPTGEKVYECGEPGGRFFVVCAGSLDFFKQHQGVSYCTRTIGFGEETGFVAMIALHEQGGTVIAREDSILLEVSSNLFSELHQSYPLDFGLLTLNLARDLARVIRKMSETLVENAILH